MFMLDSLELGYCISFVLLFSFHHKVAYVFMEVIAIMLFTGAAYGSR